MVSDKQSELTITKIENNFFIFTHETKLALQIFDFNLALSLITQRVNSQKSKISRFAAFSQQQALHSI